MNTLATICTLILGEMGALLWYMQFEQLGILNLYTMMFMFFVIDLACIYLLWVTYVPRLTLPLQAVLCLSLINHIFGALAWVTYSELVFQYDSNKGYIFYLELLVLLGWMTNGIIKRVRTMVTTHRINGISRI